MKEERDKEESKLKEGLAKKGFLEEDVFRIISGRRIAKNEDSLRKFIERTNSKMDNEIYEREEKALSDIEFYKQNKNIVSDILGEKGD